MQGFIIVRNKSSAVKMYFRVQKNPDRFTLVKGWRRENESGPYRVSLDFWNVMTRAVDQRK